jgi:hypothetical protein
MRCVMARGTAVSGFPSDAPTTLGAGTGGPARQAHLRMLSAAIHFARVSVGLFMAHPYHPAVIHSCGPGKPVGAVLMRYIPRRRLWINLWKLWIAIGNCWCCPGRVPRPRIVGEAGLDCPAFPALWGRASHRAACRGPDRRGARLVR